MSIQLCFREVGLLAGQAGKPLLLYHFGAGASAVLVSGKVGFDIELLLTGVTDISLPMLLLVLIESAQSEEYWKSLLAMCCISARELAHLASVLLRVPAQ